MRKAVETNLQADGLVSMSRKCAITLLTALIALSGALRSEVITALVLKGERTSVKQSQCCPLHHGRALCGREVFRSALGTFKQSQIVGPAPQLEPTAVNRLGISPAARASQGVPPLFALNVRLQV